MFAAGGVTIDGSSQKPSRIVERPLLVVLDSLKLAASQALAVGPAEPEAIPLRVVLEDEHLLVVDKAPGMVVHPAPGHPDGTLVNAVLHHFGALPGEDAARPGIVHRLDAGTSGVMVIARTPVARDELVRRFAAHDIERAYLAIAVGRVPAKVTYDTLHGRHPRDRKRFTSKGLTKGKRAVTHVERLRELRSASLVRCTLETGRTHQIR
ncbi:MAG: RluA family pseudouridine synthase, partial [Myxococcales bacterium]|nr:RluA family pseudouridine synthase [Myxococcales bacterium]